MLLNVREGKVRLHRQLDAGHVAALKAGTIEIANLTFKYGVFDVFRHGMSSHLGGNLM